MTKIIVSADPSLDELDIDRGIDRESEISHISISVHRGTSLVFVSTKRKGQKEWHRYFSAQPRKNKEILFWAIRLLELLRIDPEELK